MLANPCILFYYCAPSAHSVDAVEKVPPYILQAVPYFFIMILLEVLISAYKGSLGRRYSLKEMLCSLSLGLVSQLMGIPVNVVGVAAYIAVYDTLRLWTVPFDSLVCWAALVLGVDLGYYWLHRFCHEFHFGWLGHSVHHSGEYYNLATALRQGFFQSLPSSVAYLPLACIGLPPAMFLVHKQLNVLYQFWIHTELIGWLGPLEYVLNTPSHHRVHHRPGANVNYAGVFIIWDRMFGTFAAEEGPFQQDRYGLGKPLASFDPIRANVEHAIRTVPVFGWRFLFRRRLRAKWTLELRALWQPLPGDRKGLWCPPSEPSRAKHVGSVPSPRRHLIEAAYLCVSFAVCLVVYLSFEVTRKRAMEAQPYVWLNALYLLFSFCALGRLADGRPDALRLEWLRVLLLLPMCPLIFGWSPCPKMAVAACAVPLAAWAVIGRGWHVEQTRGEMAPAGGVLGDLKLQKGTKLT